MGEEKKDFRYRSLFWPILLIGVGAFWLLANLDILPDVNFRFLLRLWPVALIAFGLDVLFARKSPLLGALIGVGAVALVIALVFFAPDLGIETSGELKTLEFSEPLGGADEARVVLDLESRHFYCNFFGLELRSLMKMGYIVRLSPILLTR